MLKKKSKTVKRFLALKIITLYGNRNDNLNCNCERSEVEHSNSLKVRRE